MKTPALFLVVLLLLGCDALSSGKKGTPSAAHENHDQHGDEHADEHAVGLKELPSEKKALEKTVRLSKAALLKGTITLGKASAGTLQDALEIPAEVQIPPDHVAHVSPLVDGQLRDVRVALGARVKANQPLATLRSVALGRARAELSRTTAMRDLTKLTLERQEKLRDEGISSERSYLDAKASYDQASAERNAALSGLSVFGAGGGSGPDMLLLSPIDGTIVERHATQGENVSSGDSLFVVANTEIVWVIGQAYERQLAHVVPEMKATVTLTAFAGKSWGGKVDYIGATLTPGSRTLPVRVEIKNDQGLLRPGLFGSLHLFPGESKGEGVLVPLSAVQEFHGSPVVFVPEANEGEFSFQPVTLGRENRAQVEVLEGLSAESPIVVEGAFILKSELLRAELGHGHAH